MIFLEHSIMFTKAINWRQGFEAVFLPPHYFQPVQAMLFLIHSIFLSRFLFRHNHHLQNVSYKMDKYRMKRWQIHRLSPPSAEWSNSMHTAILYLAKDN